MIPTIGVMIGAYIFTRMLELIVDKNGKVITKVFAAISLLVAVVGVLDLIFSGSRSLPVR